MKIITIVGIRGAGKTTVLECLVKELRRRGYTVGTAKSVFCPAFHMDKPGSNTDRHARAGSQLIAARGERETALIYPRKLKPSEWLRHYLDCGWVLCEGDYELPVPRIVAAHGEEDARERVNDRTVAVSGLIANERSSFGSLPALHPERDIGALADLLEGAVPDITDFEPLDQPLAGKDAAQSRAFCLTGCKGHGKKRGGVEVTIDGAPLGMTPEQEALIRSWMPKA